MSRKVYVAFAGAALFAATMSSAFAACLTPNEQRADQVRALQTQLMVGALKCGTYSGVDIRATYNSFVQRFTPQLVAHSEVLKSYFRRQDGAAYAREMDRYVTNLANAASLQSNAPGFCERMADLAQATSTETPDEMIDSGKVNVLPVKLGETCAKKDQFVEDVAGSASGASKKSGEREASASK
jgi:hypothetical protein